MTSEEELCEIIDTMDIDVIEYEGFRKELKSDLKRGAEIVRNYKSSLLMLTVYDDGVNHSLDTYVIFTEERYYRICSNLIQRGDKFIVSLMNDSAEQLFYIEANKYQL